MPLLRLACTLFCLLICPGLGTAFAETPAPSESSTPPEEEVGISEPAADTPAVPATEVPAPDSGTDTSESGDGTETTPLSTPIPDPSWALSANQQFTSKRAQRQWGRLMRQSPCQDPECLDHWATMVAMAGLSVRTQSLIQAGKAEMRDWLGPYMPDTGSRGSEQLEMALGLIITGEQYFVAEQQRSFVESAAFGACAEDHCSIDRTDAAYAIWKRYIKVSWQFFSPRFNDLVIELGKLSYQAIPSELIQPETIEASYVEG